MWRQVLVLVIVLMVGIIFGMRYDEQMPKRDDLHTSKGIILYYYPNHPGFREGFYGVDELKEKPYFVITGGARYEVLSTIKELKELSLSQVDEVNLDYDTMDAYVYFEVIDSAGDVKFWVAIDRKTPEYMLANGSTVRTEPLFVRLVELLLPSSEYKWFMVDFQKVFD